jgi:hypothetical protein
MTNLPNFREYCEPACIKLWGQPDNRTAKELRWNGGDAYSVRTFNLHKRAWFDHGQRRGGSTLDLVDYAKGREKRELRGAVFFEVWREANVMGIVPDPAPEPNGGGKPVIATYPYHDEEGELLFEVVRFDTADPAERFRQRRPDGKGGWIWNLKGVRRVLYRLPELIAAVKTGQRVLVCEGERDANTAVKLGYVATTMPGGIDRWRKEYDDFFGAADVGVVSDNDAHGKGQAHAAKIAKRLAKVAAYVRTVMFLQKDLTEWVEAGGTREQFDALIEQAPDQTKQPPEDEDSTNPQELERLLAELNAENCVVLDGARTMVLRFETDEREAGGERYVYRLPTFLRFYDFRGLYMNRFVDTGAEKPPSLGQWWLTHPERRQYRGVVFRPAAPAIINGRLNLWTGWGVEPKQGDWHLMRQHIREVLADCDERVYQYDINWIAWSVQHPDKQAGVALVFIGDRGTGKGTLGKGLCRIFGQHALHVSNPEHLVGRFNAHLRQCCFLFADEAYGPKDKTAEGTLKRFITEDTLTIEAKGRDPIEPPNMLHVMMASNNDWVVPAGEHERRFVVQKVSNVHRQDPAWFGPLFKQMREGGYEAMLFDLLARDLGDWHPRDIVRTAALVDQQVKSLSPLDEWYLEILQTGVLAGAKSPDCACSNEYEEQIQEGTDGYGGKRTRTVKRPGLYDHARRSSPRLKAVSDTALGCYLGDQCGCTNKWVRRQRGWQFPPLAECRARWLERFPETKWRDDALAEWTLGEDDSPPEPTAGED